MSAFHLLRVKIFSILILFGLLIVSGCTTPIKKVTLPPVAIIEGTLVVQNSKGFILKDATGSIQVKAALSLAQKNQLTAGKTLKVYGNLISGEPKVFDAYVIDLQDGKRIILSNPSPKFGLFLQSSFK